MIIIAVLMLCLVGMGVVFAIMNIVRIYVVRDVLTPYQKRLVLFVFLGVMLIYGLMAYGLIDYIVKYETCQVTTQQI